MSLREIGAVLHTGRPEALELGKDLVGWSLERGIRIRCLANEVGCLGDGVPAVAEDRFGQGLDLIVVLGGDGTLLRALALAIPDQVPVLGVNLGRLGFLAEVEPPDMVAALDVVHSGRHHVELRSTLAIAASVDGATVAERIAVNDVVLEKEARERLVNVAVRIDGKLLARYAADGLIVATPTGSTAYSFSAGGPIVSPMLDALLLTPVAPHMVFDRTLVLHPSEVVTLEVLGSTGVVVNVDGQPSVTLPPGALVEVRRGEQKALLVQISPRGFYGLVRSKFHLADAGELWTRKPVR